MRHITDGTLRRLVDDPSAVSDDDIAHLDSCERCRARHAQVAADAATAAALLMRPQPLPDVDRAWERFASAGRRGTLPASGSSRPVLSTGQRWRLGPMPALRRPVVVAAALVIVAAASAVVVSTVLAPGSGSPTASKPDAIETLAAVVGIDSSHTLGGLDTASGSLSLPFGSLSWSSSGTRHVVASVAEARQETGLDVVLPAAVPAGVGSPDTVVVLPQLTVTVVLSSSAGALAGSRLQAVAGPGVLVEYGSAASSSLSLPTLAVFEMAGPKLSAGASSVTAVENYVLAQKDLPTAAAEYIKLLGDLGTQPSVPLPQGANMSRVQVNGSSGLLVSDPSDGASGAIWAASDGTVHVAVGLLDSHDILNVADQLG